MESLIPNMGKHTRWDPNDKDALPTDTATAATYIIKTSWLRAFSEGNNCLHFSSPATNASILADRISSHLETIIATDSHYMSVLRHADKTAVEKCFRALFWTHIAELKNMETDEDVLLLQRTISYVGLCATIENLFDKDTASQLATQWIDMASNYKIQYDPSKEYGTAATAGLRALLSTRSQVPVVSVPTITRILAARGVPIEAMRTNDGIIVSVCVVLGIPFFSEHRQIYSSLFVPQLVTLVHSKFGNADTCTPASIIRTIVLVTAATGLRSATDQIPLFIAAHTKRAVATCSKHLTLVAWMLAGMVDAGKFQSAPQNQQVATNTVREEFVVLASRALLEVFTSTIIVAGPMQWGTKTLERWTAEHPLTANKKNEDAQRIGSLITLKRRRTEGGIAAPFTADLWGVWDLNARILFPMFLAQCGFEWPWIQFESLLRKALGVTNDGSGPKEFVPWVPTQTDLIDKHRALSIIGDFLSILAKEIVSTTFPARLAALTAKVGDGMTLKSVCHDLDTYYQLAAMCASAHSRLLKRVKGGQQQEVVGPESFALSIDNLEGLKSIFLHPPALEQPVLAGIFSLLVSSALPGSSEEGKHADALYSAVLNKCDLMPSVIELKASNGKGLVTTKMITTIRHRLAIEVSLMSLLKISQLRSRDQVEATLFKNNSGLLETLRKASSDAAGSGLSSVTLDQALSDLKEPLPLKRFNFSSYLTNSDKIASWVDTLMLVQGYTPLSSLMENLFGTSSGFAVPHTGSLVHPSALALEEFSQKVLLRVAAVELRAPEDDSTGAFAPICSPCIDVIAWCLTYSRVLGLGTGVGSPNDVADLTFYSRFPATAKTNATAIAISHYLNPLVVDHPTRGYSIRKVLWQMSEVFAEAIHQASNETKNSHQKHVQLEAKKFRASLNAFGLLEWSLFGRTWLERFEHVLK